MTSEQTFLISIQVSDSAPLGIQPATSGQDYRTSTSVHNVIFHPFAQRIPFVFTLLADTLSEGTEVFQASVSPEDTRDISGGMHEQFPTSLHPISLESDVFITIEDDVSDCKVQISMDVCYIYFPFLFK